MGSYRKHNLHLNWSNEVKKMELMEGFMVRSGGDEYMWLWIPFGSSLFSLIVFLTHLQITIMSFFSFFFHYIYIYIYIKHLGYVREVFTLDNFVRHLKEHFHPGIFLFFSFFSSLGHLTRLSTQRWDIGASWRFSPELLFFFVFFNDLVDHYMSTTHSSTPPFLRKRDSAWLTCLCHSIVIIDLINLCCKPSLHV